MTAAAPPTALCAECGQPQPLTPAGLIARHYDDALPASVRHCTGGRQAPAEGER
jgi:hypothetical protein